MGNLFIGSFEVMFLLVFVLVIGTFVVTIFKGVRQWNKNNQMPRLTVDAIVAAKRTQVGRHSRAGSGGTSSYTHYFVTFQVESGDRLELSVDGSEYGVLVEGDRGKLSFQGTRYLGFTRL